MIKDTDIPGPVPVVGVWALVLNEGATKEDMVNQFVIDLFLGPYESVGAVEVMAGGSKQFSVRTTKGPIYFACYYDPISENSHFIGPIEVEGTNP